MNVVIFSGTTEGRLISARLAAEGAQVDVFVATEYGGEEQGNTEGIRVHIGRRTAEEMQTAVKAADMCIDATHPYAMEATDNIRAACSREKIPYYRLKRRESRLHHGDGTVIFDSVKEAAKWLSAQEGNILITTGSKELEAYAGSDPARLYPRVLPVHESIEACEKIGIPHRNIIAMQGPFSQQLNEAVIDQFDIDFLVTKESGGPGGFAEKINAAKTCGIQAVIVSRPADEGYSAEEIYEIYRRKRP